MVHIFSIIRQYCSLEHEKKKDRLSTKKSFSVACFDIKGNIDNYKWLKLKTIWEKSVNSWNLYLINSPKPPSPSLFAAEKLLVAAETLEKLNKGHQLPFFLHLFHAYLFQQSPYYQLFGPSPTQIAPNPQLNGQVKNETKTYNFFFLFSFLFEDICNTNRKLETKWKW